MLYNFTDNETLKLWLLTLHSCRHLAGVEASIKVGESILSSICNIVAGHPLKFVGIVLRALLIILVPQTLNRSADWIKNIRIAE